MPHPNSDAPAALRRRKKKFLLLRTRGWKVPRRTSSSTYAGLNLDQTAANLFFFFLFLCSGSSHMIFDLDCEGDTATSPTRRETQQNHQAREGLPISASVFGGVFLYVCSTSTPDPQNGRLHSAHISHPQLSSL